MEARWILPAVCVGLAALVAFAVDPADRAVADGGRKLVGTWRFTVNAPAPFGEFFALVVFHKGNTMTAKDFFTSPTNFLPPSTTHRPGIPRIHDLRIQGGVRSITPSE